MRVEMRREFHVPLKQAYDYLMDWRHIPDWRIGTIEILEPAKAKWSQPGDSFRFAYRLLGRRVEGDAELVEVREHELIRLTSSVPGLGSMDESWRYEPIDDESFGMVVIQESPEPTSFFGRMIDRMLLPRVLEKDLARTLDNLEDIFSMGVPE